MGHQGAGGHHRVDHAGVDHLADDLAHLGDRHRPRERQDDLASGVLDHGHRHVERLAKAPAAEGSARHAAEEGGERGRLVEVEALEGDQAVPPPVVEFAMLAHAHPP
jgi:hypothetical protein